MRDREIVVVGAGFAGVWAAAGAVRTAAELGREEDVTVTVVAPGEDMVIRPRHYEDDPSRMRVALDRVLGPIGVRRVRAEITGVDVDAHRVTGRDHDGNPVELAYDKLVLATGSTLVSPQLPGAEHLFDVDTIEAADALHQHIAQLSQDPQRPGAFTAVVVGGGFTGLEVVTELPSRLRAVAGEHPVRVVMLDRADVVGRALGDGPRPEIEAALEAEGVEVRLDTGMESLTEDSARLTDGTVIEAATVIWTAGMRAQVLTEQIPGERDDLGRLVVDEQLHVTGVPDVFAAGDTASAHADPEHLVMQACQHAVPLGKHVGRNVAADAPGGQLVDFVPEDCLTCLSLCPEAGVLTAGWDREVQLRGAEGKQQKRQINEDWIYPPVDDRQAILEPADHRKTWPID